ncbi:GGDEF domain-containing protein [Streptomyces megasporus]|uniref:GGDEF domain-containing protein n=1 Tax=Streptomyces megasporus TaxID=44060 RepID=UPI0009981BDC|nr:GGDEF domain-containing protein [Streptomyces megasporus]
MSTAPRTPEECASSPSCCSRGGHRPPTDDLTGLLVRRAWEIRASQALAFARNRHRPLAVVMGDLDRFKSINDTYGHLAGDAVLRAAAGVLRRVEGAVTGRYGGHAGDEFLMLLPDTGAGEAMATARRVRQEIRELSVPAPIGRGTTVTITGMTISLGVYAWDPVGPAPGGLSDLLLDSDAALREVKRAGGDGVRLAGAPDAPEPATGLPYVPRPARRGVHELPHSARPSWLPYGGTHRAVPAGTWWDAVRMPGRTGFRVLDAMLRYGDRPPGPVIADLPGETGEAGAEREWEERSRVYFLIPPRAADRRELPGARVLGRGSYVVVPDAASVRPPGLHWLVPPTADRRLTSFRSLLEAVERVTDPTSTPT